MKTAMAPARAGQLRWTGTLLVLGLVGALVASCSVGSQRRAATIPSREIPGALLSPAEPSATSPSPQAPTSTIYLIQGQRLIGVPRPQEPPQTLAALLRSLLRGPTDAEAASGLGTAINTGPILNSVQVTESLATIDLGASFGDIRGQSQVLAAAQVVLTATSYPGIGEVLISLDGVSAEVPLADGTLASRPLAASDYTGLVGPIPAPTPSP